MHLTRELKIGKFKVVRRLGRGGMGAVYEAFDTSLHRRVAIKTLLAQELAGEDSRRRFEREARASARLQHQNIVTIHELGNFDSEEKPYIVMEYLKGSDLSSVIREDESIPLAESLDVHQEKNDTPMFHGLTPFLGRPSDEWPVRIENFAPSSKRSARRVWRMTARRGPSGFS